MTTLKPLLFGIQALIALVLTGLCSGAVAEPEQAPQFNPRFHYFVMGQIIGDRGFTLGDPDDWSTPVQNLTGQSKGRKVQVQPDTRAQSGDAMRITWSRANVNGQVGLYGPEVDLSAFRDRAALVFDVKLYRKPRRPVTVSMDCNWPCRGNFSARPILQSMPTEQWMEFPLPLNCLRGDNFDLSKINGVFLMSTEGPLELAIANIRIEPLPQGEQGCVD